MPVGSHFINCLNHELVLYVKSQQVLMLMGEHPEHTETTTAVEIRINEKQISTT